MATLKVFFSLIVDLPKSGSSLSVLIRIHNKIQNK